MNNNEQKANRAQGYKTLFHELSHASRCLYQLWPIFKDSLRMNPGNPVGRNCVLPSCHFEHYKGSVFNYDERL